jgi:hypothetical protein
MNRIQGHATRPILHGRSPKASSSRKERLAVEAVSPTGLLCSLEKWISQEVHRQEHTICREARIPGGFERVARGQVNVNLIRIDFFRGMSV